MNLQDRVNKVAKRYVKIGILAFVIMLIVWQIAKTTQGVNLEWWIYFSIFSGLGMGLFTGLLFGPGFPIEEKEIVRRPLLAWLLLTCINFYIGSILFIASNNFLTCLLLYLGGSSSHFFSIGISYLKKNITLKLC